MRLIHSPLLHLLSLNKAGIFQHFPTKTTPSCTPTPVYFLSTSPSLLLIQVRLRHSKLSLQSVVSNLLEHLDSTTFDKTRLRGAQSHFEQAKRLDPENVVIQAFLEKVRRYPHTIYPPFSIYSLFRYQSSILAPEPNLHSTQC